MKITTEELFARLNDERPVELLPLESQIYNNEDQETESGSENAAKQAENRKKILAMLKSRRTQKILTYIAYGRHLPQPVPEEEERLYIRIKKIVEENGNAKTTNIKITVDTPEIRTPEGRRLGPFGKNTVIEIQSQQDLEFLIKNKIGEITNL